MKFLALAFAFLCFNLISFAEVIRIKKLRRTDRDFVFLLKSDAPKAKLVLDCASFFHNLDIYTPGYQNIFYLTTDECWDIHRYLTRFPYRRKCLFYEEDAFEFKSCS